MTPYFWEFQYAALLVGCLVFGRAGAIGTAVGSAIYWLVIA